MKYFATLTKGFLIYGYSFYMFAIDNSLCKVVRYNGL